MILGNIPYTYSRKNLSKCCCNEKYATRHKVHNELAACPSIWMTSMKNVKKIWL